MVHKRNNSTNPHTPSPLTHPPRTRTTSGGSTKSSPGLSRSENLSPSALSLSVPKRKGKLNSSSNKSSKSEKLQLDIDSPFNSPLCRSLWNQQKCPCNRDTDCWQIDCSKCNQYWHIECVSLDGLGEREINKLMKWTCPFCYVAPISTSETSDSCMTCRNTRTLRDANHVFEVSNAASNLKKHPIDEDSITSIDIISQQNSIKCIESEMKILSNLCQNDIGKLTTEVLQLKSELSSLTASSSQPPMPATNPTVSCIDRHDEFLKSISDRLDALTSDRPDPPAPAPAPAPSQSNTSASATQPSPLHQPPPCPLIAHSQTNVTDIINPFIDESTASTLIQFLESQTFTSENGHSVLAFGSPYSYTGSKSCTNTPTIPDILKPIFEQINTLQKDLYYTQHPSHKTMNHSAHIPQINSCLVNKYEGNQSSLPLHADDEVTIDPESSIFTLSLGESCTIKFIEQASNSSSEITCPPQSLYHMTRKSQDHYKHCIEAGSIIQGTRYSLTFRSVDWKNRNCTAVIGDSNTGFLRFGTSKRNTFGELMPGRKFWAPRIQNIDPEHCSSYSNAVILCGINDLKQPEISSEHDIGTLCESLIVKIKQIKQLNPKCFVYVCPLLPTKDACLNRKVNCFNSMLFRNLASMSDDVKCVQGFHGFAEHDGMLVDQLSKTFDRSGRPDTLHLNESGAKVLASLIKEAIFYRLHKGVDKRRGPSSRVNGRPFNSVARGPSLGPRPLQRGGGDRYQYQVW